MKLIICDSCGAIIDGSEESCKSTIGMTDKHLCYDCENDILKNMFSSKYNVEDIIGKSIKEVKDNG